MSTTHTLVSVADFNISFGAVLEEFEVEDALANALASKDTMSAEELAAQFQSPGQVDSQALFGITVNS